VLRIMDGRHVIGAHGNRSMPIWGESFAQAEAGNPDAERTTEVVLQRLTDHLRAQQR
jgi:phytoene dehydrogenase-like protein